MGTGRDLGVQVALQLTPGRGASPVARVTVTRPSIREDMGMYPVATARVSRRGNRCSSVLGWTQGLIFYTRVYSRAPPLTVGF